ncbi:MAG: VanW family protein [Spirochaetes bacterium]|nr:VanW family protein [Spirochaetota bacterium]
MNNDLKPKKRSALRIFAGKRLYILKRFIFWYFSKLKFTKTLSDEKLDFPVFSHSTPLFRDLQGVENIMQQNKKVNLELACRRISGIVLKPGETFSYWRLIGKPTKNKGYLPGMFLFYGKVGSRVGGGLCQLSNLIYWTALHTSLTVTERYRHSYDVFPDAGRTQPFGSGATCVYNYRDLMIYNGTDCDFQFNVSVEADKLRGEWRASLQPEFSYEVYEKAHSITHEPWGKYVRHNLICRKKINKEGLTVSDEFVAENHALMMYEPYIDNQKSAAADSSSR